MSSCHQEQQVCWILWEEYKYEPVRPKHELGDIN